MSGISHLVRFTDGDCWVLAHAINRLTGFPVCTFCDDLGRADYHVFVQLPDGRYLDIQGISTHEELIRRWGEGAILVWEEGELARLCPEWSSNGEPAWPASPKIAERVAQRLCATLPAITY